MLYDNRFARQPTIFFFFYTPTDGGFIYEEIFITRAELTAGDISIFKQRIEKVEEIPQVIYGVEFL